MPFEPGKNSVRSRNPLCFWQWPKSGRVTSFLPTGRSALLPNALLLFTRFCTFCGVEAVSTLTVTSYGNQGPSKSLLVAPHAPQVHLQVPDVTTIPLAYYKVSIVQGSLILSVLSTFDRPDEQVVPCTRCRV